MRQNVIFSLCRPCAYTETLTFLQLAEIRRWWIPHALTWCHFIKKKCSITQHFIQYLLCFNTNQLHIFMLELFKHDWNHTMFMYDAFAFRTCSVFWLIVDPIGPLMIAFHCTLCEGACSNRLCVGAHMQSGFIKSDQTWRNSLSSWLPPTSHTSLSWLNSATFVITLRTNSSLRRPAVYILSVTTGWHKSRITERKVPSVFNEVACVQSTQTYSMPRQTYSMCAARSLKLCPNSTLQTTDYYKALIFKIFCFCMQNINALYWQGAIKVENKLLIKL